MLIHDRLRALFIDPPPYPSPRRGRGMPLHAPLRALFAPSPFLQDVHDSRQGQVALAQGHEQVEEEVRGLLGQALVALPLRGQDHLGGLLADLLQYLVRALGHDGNEPGRVEGQAVGDGHAHGVPPSGGRTSMPALSSSAFASAIRISPKWKIDAARAAPAFPSRRTSAMCATRPQPPEATTGIVTASATARVRATSKPSLVPSRSMLVSSTSPAPRSIPSRAQATASRPVGVRPPWT